MKKGVAGFMIGWLVAGLLVLLCIQQPASAATPSKTPTPKYGGVLKQIVPLGPTIFGYPPEIMGISTMHIFGCLDCLTGMDLQGRYTPTKLSTKYEVAPDKKSLTFTLRRNVKFHDGTDWNAQAAKWNLDGQMAAKAAGTGGL